MATLYVHGSPKWGELLRSEPLNYRADFTSPKSCRNWAGVWSIDWYPLENCLICPYNLIHYVEYESENCFFFSFTIWIVSSHPQIPYLYIFLLPSRLCKYPQYFRGHYGKSKGPKFELPDSQIPVKAELVTLTQCSCFSSHVLTKHPVRSPFPTTFHILWLFCKLCKPQAQHSAECSWVHGICALFSQRMLMNWQHHTRRGLLTD